VKVDKHVSFLVLIRQRHAKLTSLVLRNKLSSTLAYLFIDVYPHNIPSFLHPFFQLLSPSDPSSSKGPNLHPVLLAIRLLLEIAQEVHDSTIKSARNFSNGRHARDGAIRDAIRSTGDERLAVEGLVGLVETALSVVEGGGQDRQKWIETADLALKALGAWIRKSFSVIRCEVYADPIAWIDLSVSLTPRTLAFYQRLIQHSSLPLRTSTAAIFRILVSKGIKDPKEKLEELKVLNVISLLEPLEAQSREVQDDSDMLVFRAGIAAVYAAYVTALIELEENVSYIPLDVSIELIVSPMPTNLHDKKQKFCSTNRYHSYFAFSVTGITRSHLPLPPWSLTCFEL